MFVTIEGIDNVGKTSICKRLKRRLGKDYSVRVVSDPPRISPWALLKPKLLGDKRMTSAARAMILLAARIDAYARVIKSDLRTEDLVLGDRFSDSWFAYQAVANRRHFKSSRKALDFLETLSKSCIENGLLTVPDKTFLIIGDVGETVKRGRRKSATVFDSMRFQRDVQEVYRLLAQRSTKRFEVVESKGRTIAQLTGALDLRIRHLLKNN
jgi:dTMP kinase